MTKARTMLKESCTLVVLTGLSACSTGSNSACAEHRSEGTSLVHAALSPPSSTQCTTDTDCVLASASTQCLFSCGYGAVSKAGAAALTAARVQAATLCGTGCDEPLPPCGSGGGEAFALCASGTCVPTAVPPPGWVSLSMASQARTLSSGPTVFTPGVCGAGVSCTQWTLTPDAALIVDVSGATREATLSAADFQAVDGIVRTLAFRSSVAGNPLWSCDPAPQGPVVSIALTYTTATVGADVTGCVEAGPAGNDPQQIFQVLDKY